MDFLRFKGVVFDFDGTLADTLSMWSDIDDMFAKKHNIVFEDDYPDTIAAMNFNQAANYTKEHFNLNMTVEEIIGEWYGYAIYEHTHNIYFKDGAVDFVRFLKKNGIKTAIASASETELIFPDNVAPVQVGAGLPADPVIQQVLQKKSHPLQLIFNTQGPGLEPHRLQEIALGVFLLHSKGAPVIAARFYGSYGLFQQLGFHIVIAVAVEDILALGYSQTRVARSG